MLYQKHIAKLPSGRKKERLLRALRKSLFIIEINRNAKNAAKQKLSRERALRPNLNADEAENIATEWFYEVRGRLWQKQDQNWYPDCWLLFLMFGVAAPDEAVVLKSFAGPQGVGGTINPLGSVSQSANANIHSPLARAAATGRAARRAANVGSAGTGGLGAPPRPLPVTVGANQVVGEKRHRVDGDHTFNVVVRKAMSAIERQKEKVELLKQMPNQAARYETEQLKLLDMYDAVAEAATGEEAATAEQTP